MQLFLPHGYRVKKDFEHYIADIAEGNWADKCCWLIQCVQGDAYQLIKSVREDQAGYEAACKLLEDNYLNKDVIREGIFKWLSKFGIPNTGKNHSTLNSKLTSLRNYMQELEEEHESPFGDVF